MRFTGITYDLMCCFGEKAKLCFWSTFQIPLAVILSDRLKWGVVEQNDIQGLDKIMETPQTLHISVLIWCWTTFFPQ
jgi:hypothetical protein